MAMFNPLDFVLLVGESDFEFSVNLLRRYPKLRILATTFANREDTLSTYPAAFQNISELELMGALVMFQVDFTTSKAADFRQFQFHKVIFHFPESIEGCYRYQVDDCVGGDSYNQFLLSCFFYEAARLLTPGGQIYVALKLEFPALNWDILRQALRTQMLDFCQNISLPCPNYPTWDPKCTRSNESFDFSNAYLLVFQLKLSFDDKSRYNQLQFLRTDPPFLPPRLTEFFPAVRAGSTSTAFLDPPEHSTSKVHSSAPPTAVTASTSEVVNCIAKALGNESKVNQLQALQIQAEPHPAFCAAGSLVPSTTTSSSTTASGTGTVIGTGSVSLLPKTRPKRSRKSLKRSSSHLETGESSANPNPMKPFVRDPLTPVIPVNREQKLFVFSYLGDFRGILYFLGCKAGQFQRWINPVKAGVVRVTASSIRRGTTTGEEVVDHTFSKQIFYTGDTCHSWVQIDFCNLRIRPTFYTMSHRSGMLGFFARNWSLLGSNDGVTWSVVREHVSDPTLNPHRFSGSWAIVRNPFQSGAPQSFSKFRIALHPNGNSCLTSSLAVSCFELYGELSG